MHRLRILLPALICVALAACGGSDSASLEGFYEITSHTDNKEGCDAEGSAVTDYSHFRLTRDEFFGQPFLALDHCTAAADEACSDLGFFRAFIQADGEWTHQISTSSYLESCYLGYTHGTIIEEPEGALRIEIRDYSQEDASLAEAQCTTDEAELRGTDMPCGSYEVFAGTPVL